MSGDRRSRRRFLADMLFVGGAVTAASVLGYVSTRTPAEDLPTGCGSPTTWDTPTPGAVGTHGGPNPSGGPPCRAEGSGAPTPAETCEVRPSGQVTIREVPGPEPVQTPKKLLRDPMAPPVRKPEPQLAGRMVPSRNRPCR